MGINKGKACAYIDKLNISNFHSIDNIVTELLRFEGLCDFAILDSFDKEKVKLLSILQDYLSSFDEKETIPTFELRNDKYLIGILNEHSKILNDDQKNRYSHRDQLMTKIKSELSPVEFEKFCSFILAEIYEFDISCPTRPSKDGGIDFYGKFSIAPKGFVNFFKNHAIYVYGQAKKYSTPVEEKDIREFSASRKAIIQGRDERVKGLIPSEFTEDPFLNLLFFITTSSFTKGAKYAAKIQNIMLKDLDMIIDDIILKGSNRIFITSSSGFNIDLSLFH